jgi:hypothetical protein
VGPKLDVKLQVSCGYPLGTTNLVAGTLLLLRLCDPAQCGPDTAAAACAAVAALLQDGCSMDPAQSPQAARLMVRELASAHAQRLITAMQHEGLAAKAAQQRPDVVVVLTLLAYREEGAASGQRKAEILQQNEKLFSAFAPSAIQVRQGHAECGGVG